MAMTPTLVQHVQLRLVQPITGRSYAIDASHLTELGRFPSIECENSIDS